MAIENPWLPPVVWQYNQLPLDGVTYLPKALRLREEKQNKLTVVHQYGTPVFAQTFCLLLCPNRDSDDKTSHYA